MTSEDCADTAREALRKSADEYLVKPMRPKELLKP